jgi:hypothetical protein
MSEIKKFPCLHGNAKRFIKQGCEASRSKAMGDLVVHGPTHKAVEMPCEPLIPVGHKAMFTAQTSISNSPHIDNLALD